MKMKTSTSRKLRYGGTSLAITALIIAVVIIINAIMTLLTQRFMWYGDMTPDLHFTISEECFDLIGAVSDEDDINSPVEMIDKFRAENKAYNAEKGLVKGDKDYRDENVMINILFPVEPDALDADDTTLYVKENAEELRAKFPDYISTEYVNAINNPKRFERYLSSNVEKISLDSIIIECGSEFRIRTLRSFYVFDKDTPFAYNGEKAFASSILAVTRSEMPLACYTVNHGESFPVSAEVDENGNALIPFLDVLENAGYRAQPIDLSKEDIPEACRLLITFNPKQDFISGNTGLQKEGELKKLDAYLEARNAFMVFLDPTTGELENLEEFLAEWGLAVRRDGDDPIVVKDSQNSNLNNYEAVIGNYDTNDLMEGWAEDLSAKVIFEDAMAIEYARDYKINSQPLANDPSKTFEIGGNPSYNRAVFTMFKSYETASGYAAGREVAKATASDPFKLMGVSVETHYEQEKYTVIEDSAYVVLCGSTDFASDRYLYSNSYGNEDLLLSVFQMCGREPVPVGLDFKEFANYEIEEISTGDATKYTVALTVAPLVIALCAGVFVLVRRKNR
jgi:hypothetical protein